MLISLETENYDYRLRQSDKKKQFTVYHNKNFSSDIFYLNENSSLPCHM